MTIGTRFRIRSPPPSARWLSALFAAGSEALGDGHLLAAVELQHYDGPFVTPDDARKENLVLRYSEGDEHNGYSATGMFYHQIWTNTTDIPLRAIAEGLVPDRFGTLDPTDGGHAQRASFVVNYHALVATGNSRPAHSSSTTSCICSMTSRIFCSIPVHGDQEDQFENRRVSGSAASYTLPVTLGPIQNEILGRRPYALRPVGRRTHARARIKCHCAAGRRSCVVLQ